jgi:serine/threonine protein phosphatase PrpC
METLIQNAYARSIRVFSRTDVGKRRQRNEDALGVISRHGVFVVADGMGGVDGGDYASRRVVDDLVRLFQDLDPEDLSFDQRVDLVCQSVNDSSAAIREEADHRDIHGMGTTFVALCLDLQDPNRACALHVGDSRVYQFTGNRLRPVTTDHSLAAESGLEDAAAIPLFMAGVITRAVGVKRQVEVDRTPVYPRPGDRFMLCSDGLYNMIPEPELQDIFIREEEDIAAALVNCANHAGGFDNITVVVLQLPGEPPKVNPLDDTVM